MYIGKSTQDSHGVIRPPLSAPRGETGDRARAPGAGRETGAAGSPPVERVVEGEWLKGRADGAADNLFERVWRQRRADSGGESFREPASPQAAQRAIDAYLDQAAQFERRGAGRSARVDYYA